MIGTARLETTPSVDVVIRHKATKTKAGFTGTKDLQTDGDDANASDDTHALHGGVVTVDIVAPRGHHRAGTYPIGFGGTNVHFTPGAAGSGVVVGLRAGTVVIEVAMRRRRF